MQPLWNHHLRPTDMSDDSPREEGLEADTSTAASISSSYNTHSSGGLGEKTEDIIAWTIPNFVYGDNLSVEKNRTGKSNPICCHHGHIWMDTRDLR